MTFLKISLNNIVILCLALAGASAFANPQVAPKVIHAKLNSMTCEDSLNSNQQSDREIDQMFEFGWRDIECNLDPNKKIISAHGEASWSQGSNDCGWQTPYKDIVTALAALNIKPNQLLVDIGSGYGRVGMVMGSLYPEARYLGYEIVGTRVSESQRIAELHGFTNINFSLQDLSARSFQIPCAEFYYMYDPVNVDTLTSLISQIGERCGEKNTKIIFFAARGRTYSALRKLPGLELDREDEQSLMYIFRVKN